MVYHFFPQGIYANQFIDFMRKNTDKLYNEHKFLFLSYGETEPNKIFDSKDCANVYSFFSILKIFLFAKKDDRFIIHNYTHPYLYLSTACMCWKLKKVAWIIWGGDLYWHNSPKKKITTENYFNTKGLKFFLTDDIENMSFEEFKYFSQQDGELNESIITKMFSDETLVEQWNNFFINLTRLT
ncbi:hypothetical protein [Treponema phagedenis]|uniref:hypothetical protein n=1 Tax=Treponema phagedenis TaxID=162 RepID=UPI001583A146|nr:hypothetical protein [Treponema phagedenis]QKS92642.1 hypothetical protein HPJ96_08840 [Treponema phagedenis]